MSYQDTIQSVKVIYYILSLKIILDYYKIINITLYMSFNYKLDTTALSS